MRITSTLLVCVTFASATVTGDDRAAKGFEHFYNLEYDQSIAEFRRLVATDPANPNFQNHLAQAVLYREMFRGGALESELVSGTNPFIRREKLGASNEATKEFDSAIKRAMDISQARLDKNQNDVTAALRFGRISRLARKLQLPGTQGMDGFAEGRDCGPKGSQPRCRA